MNTKDERTSKAPPWGWVLMEDNFLSGWGEAPGRAYYALAVSSSAEAATVLENARKRTEMRRQRVVRELPDLGEKDQITLADRSLAARWYMEEGFGARYHAPLERR